MDGVIVVMFVRLVNKTIVFLQLRMSPKARKIKPLARKLMTLSAHIYTEARASPWLVKPILS